MMLCRNGSINDIKTKKWIGSRKFDGIRCLATCDGKNVGLVGRSGNNYTWKFPEVVEALKGFNGILDGEIVCCDNFQSTQSRTLTDDKLRQKILAKKFPATYNVFDIIRFNEKDTRKMPLIERLHLLEVVLKKNKTINLVENTSDLNYIINKAIENRWEGIIIKNPLSDYKENHRSPNWLKIKLKKSKDIKFIKFEENPAGIRVEDKNGIAIQCAGINGKVVKEEFQKKGYAIIEVEFLEEFESGSLRQPVFKELKR